MSESKHTKLPWHVHHRNPLVLQAADGNIALMNLARPSEESEANAAFIVTACNSHAELVEALEEATWLMREALARTPKDDLTQRELLTDAIQQSDTTLSRTRSTP